MLKWLATSLSVAGLVVLAAVSTESAGVKEGVQVKVSGTGLPGLTETMDEQAVPRGALSWYVFDKRCRNEADRDAAVQFYPAGVGPGRKCKLVAFGSRNNLVTTQGKNHLAAYLAGSVSFANFHGLSTSNSAPVVGDTGCGSEFTTQYSPDNTRTAGTKSSAANVFTTEATYVIDQAVTINKFCLMTNNTVGSGENFTNILTGAIPVSAGQTVTTIYRLTVN